MCPCEGIPACMTLMVCCAGPQTKVAAGVAYPPLPGIQGLEALQNFAVCAMHIIKPQHGWSIFTASPAAITFVRARQRLHLNVVSTPSSMQGWAFYAGWEFVRREIICFPLDIDRTKLNGVMSHPRAIRNHESVMRRHSYGIRPEPVRCR